MTLRVAVTGGKADEVERYRRALSLVGIEPVVVVPPDDRPLDKMGVDGLLLTGGTDVDAELYGQAKAAESEEPDRDRDALEMRVLAEALQRDLPVLAICRGMQLLNVHRKGTLLQHHGQQETHRQRPADRSQPAHDVQVEPGTRLATILGPGGFAVNSRHHQAVDRIGKGLVVSAKAADEVIEALEDPALRFLVAVQWHPEDQLGEARQRKLFEGFKNSLSR